MSEFTRDISSVQSPEKGDMMTRGYITAEYKGGLACLRDTVDSTTVLGELATRPERMCMIDRARLLRTLAEKARTMADDAEAMAAETEALEL